MTQYLREIGAISKMKRANRSSQPTIRPVNFAKATWAKVLKEDKVFEISMDTFENKNSFVTKLSISVQISEFHKSKANFREAYLSELLDQLVTIFRKKSIYQKAGVYPVPVDWYSDYTDIYETPVFTHEKGSRKNKVDYNSRGSIPKGWTIDAFVRFEGELSARMRNSILKDFLELLGLPYNAEVEKQVKANLEKPLRAGSHRTIYEVDTY